MKFKRSIKYLSFLIFIYLFIIICNSGVNGQLSLVDVTTNKNAYKKYSNQGKCSDGFTFNVLLNDNSGSLISNEDLSIQATDSFNSPSFSGVFNSTARLFKVIATTNPAYDIGEHSVNIEGTNKILTTNLIIKFTCLDFDVNNITYDYTPSLEPNVFGDIASFFKIRGIEYPFDVQYPFAASNLYTSKMSTSTYYVNYPSRESFDPLNVFFIGSNKIRSFKGYYSLDDFVFVDDFQIFPKLNHNDIRSMGQLLFPLFTFTSNTTYYSPPFSIKIGSTQRSLVFKLISTNGNIKKYIGYLDNTLYGSGNPINFSILSKNNTNLYTAKIFENITNSNYPSPNANPNNPTKSSTQNGRIVTVEFTSDNEYYFAPYYIQNNLQSVINYPFGFSGSNKLGITFKVDFLIPDYITNLKYLMFFSDLSTLIIIKDIQSPISITDKSIPNLKNYEFIQIFGHMYILRFNINYQYPIYKISTKSQVFNLASLVSGDKFGGAFEFVVNLMQPFDKLSINDDSNFSFGDGDYYSLTELKPFYLPKITNDTFNIFDIKNVSLLYKTLNVTNQNAYNVLYFNYTAGAGSVDIKNIAISLLFDGPISTDVQSMGTYQLDTVTMGNQLWLAKWNDAIQMFQIEFYISKNTQPGKIPYALFFNYANWVPNTIMGQDAQLTVISDNADLYGPIFEDIVTLSAGSYVNIVPNNGGYTNIGWNLTIIDEINGIRNGSITVRGEIDGSTYNFKLSCPPNTFKTTFTISIPIYYICATQGYAITNVVLYDNENNNSTFSIYSPYKSAVESMANPFINFLEYPLINKITVNCGSQPSDLTSPQITSFSLSNNTVDVGLIDEKRSITVTFTAIDNESGIKENSYPIVYFSTTNFQTVECLASNVKIINDNSNQYECTAYFPLGFAYPYGITVSVYGLVNRGGYYGGYSFSQLISTFPSSNLFITTTYTIDQPIIIGSDKISTKGGKLFIYGKSLDKAVSVVYSNSSTKVNGIIVKKIASSALLLNGIPSFSSMFSITVFTANSIASNEFNITPFDGIYNYTPEPTDTPQPTETPPPPTNKPQKCIGNCGGEKQGYCADSGCVCLNNYVGLDCLSQVIIVPTPSINQTSPSTEIPIIDSDDDDDGETSNYLFKSLISIISLRELSFDKIVIKNYTFDRWIFTPIDENSSKYFTSLNVISSSTGETTNTNVTVILQWFKNQTTINFANQQLVMMPSSMKYTIEISSYNFETNLNSLQLVMMASLESSKTNDICSTSSFGETSNGDNSNYVKIQIDNRSLYGRFIKRALIDSKTISIDNTPLDSSFNPIIKASSLQSFIGITIPNYQHSITIDPDFSVLVDGNKAENGNGDNLICNKSSSGLTTSQLAGIIVGSVVLFISLVIIIVVVVYRHRKHTLFLIRIKEIAMVNA